jgi:hypothetical protein
MSLATAALVSGCAGGDGGSGSGDRQVGDEPVATVAHCTDGNGIAQIMFDNSADAKGGYTVKVTFLDAGGKTVEVVSKTVDVTGKGGLVTPVQMSDPSRDDGKLTCKVTSLTAG